MNNKSVCSLAGAFGSAVAIALSTLMFASTANADLLDTPWSGGGTGTTAVVSDGTTPPAEFDYDSLGTYSGNWHFDAVAASTRTVVLKYEYIGLHAWYRVTVGLNAVFDGNVYALVNDGPEDCCTPPSNGFQYSGMVALPVQAGDTYGFQMNGTNYDSNQILRGTLVVDELGKDDCKKGGWEDIVDLNGDPLFKNQGDCVSFVATGGRNEPGKNQRK